MREVAQEERAGLDLQPSMALDPYALAAEHGIPVYTLSDLLEHDLDPGTVEHFQHARRGTWSAALLPLGRARVIVENDAHAPVRRRSNIAHELGHHLLEHDFATLILGEDHRRQFDKTQEKQATFIAGELLVPDAAARQAAYSGWDNARVAQAFDVSESFAQMRMAGARIIAQRVDRKHGNRI